LELTQLIWDAESTLPRNEVDHFWTSDRLADEFFLCLCLNKKYYDQAASLMFRIPLTEQFPKTENEALAFEIDFCDISPKVQDEFVQYCAVYTKKKVTVFLKRIVIRLFQNLDFEFAHMSVMKKLRVESKSSR
jgi:hypothetical protein